MSELLVIGYDTPEEASRAIEIAEKRNQAWAADDAAWEGEDS